MMFLHVFLHQQQQQQKQQQQQTREEAETLTQSSPPHNNLQLQHKQQVSALKSGSHIFNKNTRDAPIPLFYKPIWVLTDTKYRYEY